MKRSMWSSKWLVLLPVAALVLVPVGCGKKAADKAAEKIVEKAIEDGMARDGKKADVKVDLSKGEMTVESKGEGSDSFKMSTKDNSTSITNADGSKVVMGEGATVPANFPKDVPVYEGMKVTMSAVEPAQETFSISAMTSDSVEKVANFFKEKAKANGWTEEVAMAQGGGEMYTLSYSKEKRSLSVMVMKTGEGTGIQIVTANE